MTYVGEGRNMECGGREGGGGGDLFWVFLRINPVAKWVEELKDHEESTFMSSYIGFCKPKMWTNVVPYIQIFTTLE